MTQLLTKLREKHCRMYNPGSPEAHVGLVLPLSLPTAGLQSLGQSARCAAASEDSSKAGALGLFSAMTASLDLVPHLPKECF